MKRRYYVLLVLFILLLCLSITAHADDEKKSGLFTYRLKGNGTAVITSFDWDSNYSSDVYIPRTIDGYTVTEIGAEAFADKNDFQSLGSDSSLFMEIYYSSMDPIVVVLPDTITVIGEKAFFCSGISLCSIPASVQIIGDGAFAGCKNLKSHSVDPNNIYYATIDGILYNKAEKVLVSAPVSDPYTVPLTIPKGIKAIGSYAFYSVEFIIDNEKYNNAIEFPSTLETIGDWAFAKGKINKKFKNRGNDLSILFNQVTDIGDNAFEYCDMENVVNLHFSNVKRIGQNAFSHVTGGNTQLTFAECLNEIGPGAFSFLTGIKDSLDLSSTNITRIPEECFLGIEFSPKSGWGDIILPNQVEYIGKSSFQSIGYYNQLYVFGINIDIPHNLEEIADEAFMNSYVRLSIKNDSILKKIGDRAFYNSYFKFGGEKEEKTLVLPDELEYIGSQTFVTMKDCISILSVPSSVKYIGENFIDRASTKLKVVSGSYAAIYASENGYSVLNDDSSWLDN